MSELENQETNSAECLPCFSSPRRSEKPCYTNGLTTVKTYLVVAVNEQYPEYNALVVYRIDADIYKLHFWPSIRPFGLKEMPARLYRRPNPGLSNGPYEGCYMSQKKLIELLNELRLFV